jgi:chromate reductase, NAD(P)H dehydrogenase (quinone)
MTGVDDATIVTVLAISGSLRRVSSNRALINAVARLAPAGVEVSLYDRLQHIPAFNPDLDTTEPVSEVREFRAALQRCDAILISSPEYAHGVPGVLKNALDWVVSSGEFVDKPVAVVNASGRATHAWNSLLETLTVMSARVIGEASVTVPLDGKTLDADRIAADTHLAPLLETALRRLVAVVPVRRT